jgi:hypothetical protein
MGLEIDRQGGVKGLILASWAPVPEGLWRNGLHAKINRFQWEFGSGWSAS